MTTSSHLKQVNKMKTAKLSQMVRGWFIGDFSPSLYQTKDFEASVKFFKQGEKEAKHKHAIATEFTVIISGKVCMNGQIFSEGDIIILAPGEIADFSCLEEATTCVIKVPSANNDKIIEE